MECNEKSGSRPAVGWYEGLLTQWFGQEVELLLTGHRARAEASLGRKVATCARPTRPAWKGSWRVGRFWIRSSARSCVVRVNPCNGVIEDFVMNKGRRFGPASKIGGGGLERPVDVRLNRAGTRSCGCRPAPWFHRGSSLGEDSGPDRLIKSDPTTT
jgi:hypothetical protein